MAIVGVPKEVAPGERRVALVPASVGPLVKLGLEVWIEHDAGDAAGFPDPLYVQAGAKIAARDALYASAAIVVQVAGHGVHAATAEADLPRIRDGQAVIAFQEALSNPRAARALAARRALSFAMELMPRITRAQSMDALSSMATIAGYKAVLVAASTLPRLLPMLTTAAGSYPPARAFIIGAGVAGLQAIATAKRLGAIVSAYDVRPAAREQVESVGARFVELPLDTAQSEDKGGYAKALGEDFYKRQRELLAKVVAESDLVITTAAVPGKKAPVLVTRDMVAGMTPGSVIVDLAAERGGNCELTRGGETVVERGVTILGPLNLPSTVPGQSSQMYARNVVTFLQHLCPEGALRADLETDEIARETLVTRGGEVVHPRVRDALTAT